MLKNLTTGHRLLLLGLLPIVTYLGSLTNDFKLDDFLYLEGHLQHQYIGLSDFFTQIKSRHYNPLNYLLNITLFRLLPRNPIAFHLINVLFFVCNILLFFLLSLKITSKKSIAFMAALFFALHPINTETVNHITLNIIILFGIFMQMSMLFYLSYSRQSRNKFTLALSVLFFILALISQELAILFPLYLGILLYFSEKYSFAKTLKKNTPFVILSFGYVVLWLQQAGSEAKLIENLNALNLTPLAYITSLSKLIYWYIQNLFAPHSIVFIYNISPNTVNQILYMTIFICSLLISCFLILYRWKRDIRSLALLWFISGFILVFPASLAHAYMGMVIEPYWFFFSSLGFFLLSSVLIDKISNEKLKVTIMIVISIFLFGATQHYHRLGKTEKTYTSYWHSITPTNYLPLMSLAKLYATEGDYDKAFAFYQKALNQTNFRSHLVKYNLGLLYIEQKEFDRAKKILKKSIELKPTFAKSYNALATIAVHEKDYQKAEQYFHKSIEINPYLTISRHNLADLYLLQNRGAEALSVITQTLSIESNPTERIILSSKLAALNFQRKNLEESLKIIEEILTHHKSALNFVILAQTLMDFKNYDLATDILNQGRKFYPSEKEIFLLHGIIEVNRKNFKEAALWWEYGKKIAPDDKRFEKNLETIKNFLPNS